MQANTALTRTEYINVVKKWVQDNPEQFQLLRQEFPRRFWSVIQKTLEPIHGRPKWRHELNKPYSKVNGSLPTKADQGEYYQIYNQGSAENPTPGFKSIADRNTHAGRGKRPITYSSEEKRQEAKLIENSFKKYNAGDNPWGEKLTESHPYFKRIEHHIKISDPFWQSSKAIDLGIGSGDPENIIDTNPADWKVKDKEEKLAVNGNKIVFFDDAGDLRMMKRDDYDPMASHFDQGDIVSNFDARKASIDRGYNSESEFEKNVNGINGGLKAAGDESLKQIDDLTGGMVSAAKNGIQAGEWINDIFQPNSMKVDMQKYSTQTKRQSWELSYKPKTN